MIHKSDIRLKNVLFLIVFGSLLFTAGFVSSYVFLQPVFQNHRDPIGYANVYVICETAKGHASGPHTQHIGGFTFTIPCGNVITDIGERYVRNTMGWDNQTAFNATQWIAVGNSTCVDTETKLDAEAGAGQNFYRRANASCVGWWNGTDYAFNVTGPKMTANASIAINATSIHWSGTLDSDGNMYAVASLTGGSQAFAVNDNCTIVWVLTFDFND